MILLNEKAYVEEHYLKNNEIGDKPRETVKLLAKYYRQAMGYGSRKTEQLINDYMNMNYHNKYIASKMYWEDTIESITRRNKNTPLYEFDCIWITKSEIEKIQSIGNRDMECVLFVHLCIAKLNNMKDENKDSWVNNSAREIFKLARVKRKDIDKYLMLHEIMLLGLIEFPKQTGRLSTRVTFVDNDSEKVLRINDFRELGYEYLNYVGDGKFTRCAECGILFESSGKGRPRKYCENCANDNDGNKTRVVKCVDCGTVFEVNVSNKRTVRCSECQYMRESELAKMRKRKQRN